MTMGKRLRWRRRTLTGIVFDLDGTLTNSIELFYQVFRHETKRFGISVTRKQILEPLAEGPIRVWDLAVPEEMPNRDEKIKQMKRRIGPEFEKSLKQVVPLDGVGQVLGTLHSAGLKLGLLTDSGEYALDVLNAYELTHYFHAIVTRDDGYPLKPEPDGLLECLQRMEVDPERALVVGDAVVDIRAGMQVGTLTIGVLTGLASRRQLEEARATAIIENVKELPALLTSGSTSESAS